VIVGVVGMAMAEGGPQGGTGLFDPSPTEVTGALVEAPVGLDGHRFAGEEMQLRFHGSQYEQGV
jgi:hypothetical protein